MQRRVLESWKEIAAYLHKSVRTVQRFERNLGLPVRRTAGRRSGILAFEDELDGWLIRQFAVGNDRRHPDADRFRLLFETAPDAILIANDQRQYVDANPAASVMLGYSLEELLSLTIDDLVASNGQPVEEIWQDFLAKKVLYGRARLRRKDGTIISVEYASRAYYVPGRHYAILRRSGSDS